MLLKIGAKFFYTYALMHVSGDTAKKFQQKNHGLRQKRIDT